MVQLPIKKHIFGECKRPTDSYLFFSSYRKVTLQRHKLLHLSSYTENLFNHFTLCFMSGKPPEHTHIWQWHTAVWCLISDTYYLYRWGVKCALTEVEAVCTSLISARIFAIFSLSENLTKHSNSSQAKSNVSCERNATWNGTVRGTKANSQYWLLIV